MFPVLPPRAKPLPIQPFADEPPDGLTTALLFAPRPGGGPRGALLTGAPHNSDVVEVGCGPESDQLLPPFEPSFDIVLKIFKFKNNG